MLTSFSQGFILGLGSHWALSYYFPDTYKHILLQGFYGLIYTYSKLEYYYKKGSTYYLISNTNDNSLNNSKSSVSVIKDGSCVNIYSPINAINITESFDFLIHSVFSTKDNIYYKIIYFEIPSCLQYEICSFKFMSLTVTINENSYSIQLTSPIYNYYVVSNIINKDVICYLLESQHFIELDIPNLTYKLDIIDQHVLVKTICEKDAILFNQNNNYTILYGNPDDVEYDDDDDSLPDLLPIESSYENIEKDE